MKTGSPEPQCARGAAVRQAAGTLPSADTLPPHRLLHAPGQLALLWVVRIKHSAPFLATCPSLHHTNESALGPGTESCRSGAESSRSSQVVGETRPPVASDYRGSSVLADGSPGAVGAQGKVCPSESFLKGTRPELSPEGQAGPARRSADEERGEGQFGRGKGRCADTPERERVVRLGRRKRFSMLDIAVLRNEKSGRQGLPWPGWGNTTRSSATVAEDMPCCPVTESQDARGEGLCDGSQPRESQQCSGTPRTTQGQGWLHGEQGS